MVNLKKKTNMKNKLIVRFRIILGITLFGLTVKEMDKWSETHNENI